MVAGFKEVTQKTGVFMQFQPKPDCLQETTEVYHISLIPLMFCVVWERIGSGSDFILNVLLWVTLSYLQKVSPSGVGGTSDNKGRSEVRHLALNSPLTLWLWKTSYIIPETLLLSCLCFRTDNRFLNPYLVVQRPLAEGGSHTTSLIVSPKQSLLSQESCMFPLWCPKVMHPSQINLHWPFCYLCRIIVCNKNRKSD